MGLIPSPSEFREVVSGRRRGAKAAAQRLLLRLAETPYALAVRWRNRRYDRGRAVVQRVAVPVIGVGNLTLGGTGKTPLVEWLARWLRTRGIRVTIVSRGYGAEKGALNDEALELEQKLPDVPHVQNPNRVEAAQLAIEEFECQCILLDDAFQHRRIARDLDIVLLDALEPFGFEHVFPRGTLREPACGVRRAQIVALSRADMLSPDERQALRNRALRYAPDAQWMELAHAPRRYVNASGQEQSLESLRGNRVAAFCGIGNPAGFKHTLDRCGVELTGWREFPDHYGYQRNDVAALETWAGEQDVAAVLCTCKDLVKLKVQQLGGRPLWAVSIELDLLAGQASLEARLDEIVAQIQRPETP